MSQEDIEKDESKKIEVIITTILVAATVLKSGIPPDSRTNVTFIVKTCNDAAKQILKLANA